MAEPNQIVHAGPFLDGWDGRTPIGIDGLPRITCGGGCPFQSGDYDDLIVKPNGHSIVNWGAATPGGEVILHPPPWPPNPGWPHASQLGVGASATLPHQAAATPARAAPEPAPEPRRR